MQSRSKLVKYEEAENRIGVLPSLHPRPNSKNMRALIKVSEERLQGIPSYQSLRFGFRGFITPAAVYALTGEQPWVDYQDPGWHRPLGGNAAQQRDTDVRFTVASNIYNSQENVRQAYLKALNVAVPEAYRRAQGDMSPATYSPTDDPRAILLNLQRRYGKRTPTEKEEAAIQWSRAWNPSDPIEQMFFDLEELYVQAVVAEVPYTMVQLVDEGLSKIKKTGIFTANVTTWAARDAAEKNWQNMKAHFIAAYDAHLESGPTAGTAGYHGAAAAMSDDDSLGSITNSIAQMNMANNANIRAMNDTMSTTNEEMRKALVATQQQVAALAKIINDNHHAPGGQAPAWSVPPMGANQYYAAAAAAPMGWNYPPPPPPPPAPDIFQTYAAAMGGGRGRGRGRGRGGRGLGGRGRRGGVGFQATPPQTNNYQGGPTAPQGAPPRGGGRGGRGGGGYGNQENPYKKWNNWNACYSCGFDVPGWHTSQTCPWECRRDNHQEAYKRGDYESYVQAGWKPSRVGKHKKYLPVPGTEYGA